RLLRNDDRRDAQDAGRLDGDSPAALSATTHLGEIQARREIPSAGAEENSSALDQQSLESGMARPGRSGQHRQIFRRSKTGMDHQNGRAVLHRSRILTVAGKFLEKIRFISRAAGRQAEDRKTVV